MPLSSPKRKLTLFWFLLCAMTDRATALVLVVDIMIGGCPSFLALLLGCAVAVFYRITFLWNPMTSLFRYSSQTKRHFSMNKKAAELLCSAACILTILCTSVLSSRSRCHSHNRCCHHSRSRRCCYCHQTQSHCHSSSTE